MMPPTCAAGQLLQYNSAGWHCATPLQPIAAADAGKYCRADAEGASVVCDVQPAALATPPSCMPPGGARLEYTAASGWACVCEPGYSGVSCTVGSGSGSSSCAPPPCDAPGGTGTYTLSGGVFTCVCARGYAGAPCVTVAGASQLPPPPPPLPPPLPSPSLSALPTAPCKQTLIGPLTGATFGDVRADPQHGAYYVAGSMSSGTATLTFPGGAVIGKAPNADASFFVVRLNATGGIVWVVQLGSTTCNAGAVAVDAASGDVYAGCSQVWKLSPATGSVLWTVSVAGALVQSGALAPSGTGALYAISGSALSVLDAASGELRYSVYAGDYGTTLAVNAATGECYFAGTFSDPGTYTVGGSTFTVSKAPNAGNGSPSFIAKIGATGTVAWASGLSSSFNTGVVSMLVDLADGGIIFGGWANVAPLTLGPDAVNAPGVIPSARFVAKVSAAGTLAWSSELNAGEMPNGLAFDPSSPTASATSVVVVATSQLYLVSMLTGGGNISQRVAVAAVNVNPAFSSLAPFAAAGNASAFLTTVRAFGENSMTYYGTVAALSPFAPGCSASFP